MSQGERAGDRRSPGERPGGAVQLPDHCSPAVATWLQHVQAVRVVAGLPGPCASSLVKGKITLLVDSAWPTYTPAVQRELLNHELGHFLFDHFGRRGERDPMRFNLVCDAALDHVGVQDSALLWAAGHPGVTFEGLGIPPCPPEVAYEMLPESNGGGCGSLSASEHDGSGESLLTQLQVLTAVLAADPALRARLGRQGGQGAGRAVPELAAPKPWIRQVLAYLSAYSVRLDRTRSWRREHRTVSGLPGRSKTTGIGCRIFVDASGSVGEADLNDFLSAVCGTPELAGSDVVVFDGTASDPMPATAHGAIVAAVSARGGGTAIRATSALRQRGQPAVWLTDAESGDGWPDPHSAPEVWCVVGGAPVPSGYRVQVDG